MAILDRILVVSDLHLTQRWFDWLVERAPDHDAVVVAGDTLTATHLSHSGPEPLVDLVDRLTAHTTTIICSGNHDLDDRADGELAPTWVSAVRSLGAHADGDLVLAPDLAISVCAWWDGPLGAARLRRQLDEHSAAVGDRQWIWVHHAPAAGSATAWDGRRDCGDGHLTRLVDQHRPAAVLSGHVHHAPFEGGSWQTRRGSTLLLNAGQRSGAQPAHMVIDRRTSTVAWRGLPDLPVEETISLPAPRHHVAA